MQAWAAKRRSCKSVSQVQVRRHGGRCFGRDTEFKAPGTNNIFGKGSNLRRESQSLECCRYTTEENFSCTAGRSRTPITGSVDRRLNPLDHGGVSRARFLCRKSPKNKKALEPYGWRASSARKNAPYETTDLRICSFETVKNFLPVPYRLFRAG